MAKVVKRWQGGKVAKRSKVALMGLVAGWQKHWDKSDLQPAMVRQVACLTGAPGFNLPLKCHRPSIAKEKLKSEIYGRYGS